MSEEMRELETEVMRLMKVNGKNPKHSSLLYADALKKIQTAKKSGNPQDIMTAYQIVIDLGYSMQQRESDDIAIVIDTLAHYSGQFIQTRYRSTEELMIQVESLVPMQDSLIQHYLHKLRIQACYKAKPDNDDFWQAWGVVYELAIQHRCEVQAQVIKRLFAVHGRDLNIRKAS